MDRNQVIGFVLLVAILFSWMFFFSPKEEDRKAAGQQEDQTKTFDSLYRNDTGKREAPSQQARHLLQKDSFVTISTSKAGYTFNLKGGALTKIVLHANPSADSASTVSFSYSPKWYQFNNGQLPYKSNYDLSFYMVEQKEEKGAITIRLQTSAEKNLLEHIYTLRPNNHTIEWSISSNDLSYWFADEPILMRYDAQLYPSERDMSYEKRMSEINYSTTEDNFDFIHLKDDLSSNVEEPIKWIGYKQRFFNTSLSANGAPLSKVTINATMKDESPSAQAAFADISASFSTPTKQKTALSFTLYAGENDYHTLSGLDETFPNLKEIIDYGRGIFSFVKYLNRGIVLPLFSWIAKHILTMGWAIAFLTIFIRLVTSPLVYSSYLSSAKMKMLRPELAELRKKCGDDKQKYSIEQMNLFRQAGVNPLGGCIPALLQIPIFLALYSFFNSNIQLRGESFLWAKDLSSYDAIAHFSFNVPFYGNHISLFTITAAATSFLISLFSANANSSSPELANNPALKYMPYIFPFFLLFIFNSMPAALTWYYTISNSITLIIQFVINRFIIDHEKILARIEENKKKIRKKTGFQQRLETIQKTREQKKN